MMRKRDVFFIAVAFSLLYIPVISKAETPFSPVSIGAGRARVATNDYGTQALSNPAILVHAKGVSTSISYLGGQSDADERIEETTLAIIDNSDDVFISGGFVYSRAKNSYKNLQDFDSERFHASFAQFIYHQLSMGMNLKYMSTSVDTAEKIWDWDIGFLWNPVHDLAVGALFENLAHHSNQIPAHIRPLDRSTFGINYLLMKQFHLRADVTRVTERGADSGGDWDLRTGLESYLDNWFVVRMGYEIENSQDRDFVSAGFGLVGPRLNIDYAYRKNTEFSDGALHSVDFRVPF